MRKSTSAITYTSRRQIVDRIRRELERRSYPRLQMMLLVSLTGGAGFLASYVLLHFGFETLSWRYRLSVAIAYGVFLLLLWLWLRTDFDDYGFDDVLVDIAESAPARHGRDLHYKEGGEFSGGGASGRWENSTSEPLVELPELPGIGKVGGLADADEAAIPIGILFAVVAVVVTVLVASFSIVYSAPVLFAELLLDGVLAATLYRRLRRLDSRHWLQSAVRRTIVPFAITAALVMAAGWGLSVYAPAARSLGDVLALL